MTRKSIKKAWRAECAEWTRIGGTQEEPRMGWKYKLSLRAWIAKEGTPEMKAWLKAKRQKPSRKGRKYHGGLYQVSQVS